MKARLIVSQDAEWPISVDSHLCLWPLERAIPKGWEEITLATPSLKSVDPNPRPILSSDFDLCTCSHDRRSHALHGHQCLVRRDAKGCECLRFREPA